MLFLFLFFYLFSRKSKLLFFTKLTFTFNNYCMEQFGHPGKQLLLYSTKKRKIGLYIPFMKLLWDQRRLGFTTRNVLHKLSPEVSSQQRRTTVFPLSLIAFKICACLWRLCGVSDGDMWRRWQLIVRVQLSLMVTRYLPDLFWRMCPPFLWSQGSTAFSY